MKFGITKRQIPFLLLRRAIHEFNWTRALSNLNVDEQVMRLQVNWATLNILENFISREKDMMTRIRHGTRKQLSP